MEGGQIGDQACAKNCITVGACDTSHPLTFQVDREPQTKYATSGLLGSTNRLATYSSFGPTRNSAISGPGSIRFKPDVVAPGTVVYSAKTTDPGVIYPPGKAPPNNFSYFGDPPDTAPNDLYIFRSGTSMAAPIVAGCCAVIRAALRRSLPSSATETAISSAMIKAVLINGTTDMTDSPVPQHTDKNGNLRVIGRAPSGKQGFGVVNLAKSLLCVPGLAGGNGGVYPMISHVAGLAQGGTTTVNIAILPPPATAGTSLGALVPKLTITMCYTDFVGVHFDGSLINKLTLRVEAGSPTTVIYGNTGTASPDTMNNVQKVVWEDIPSPVNAIVECTLLNRGLNPVVGDNRAGGQDFALAWYVDFVPPTSPAGPSSSSSSTSTFQYYNHFSSSSSAVGNVINLSAAMENEEKKSSSNN
jgi:hypothetical protein